MTVKFVVDIREKDIDGNKVDTDKIIQRIYNSLKKEWNISGINFSPKNDRIKL